MDTVITSPMYGWDTLPWKKFRKCVWKLQKRIYRATEQGNKKLVRSLQRLLMKARAAKFLAVRRVAQENRGKRTAGIDGVKSLTPRQRLRMAESLSLDGSAMPVRRVWIDKPDSVEMRPLGIPVMVSRARETLVKMALEPQWEARFEANSYGFRPGRSTHDATEAIFLSIKQKAKYVLDADVAKCFDKIGHEALLARVDASPSVRRQLKAWLKSGVMDGGELFPTQEGTMQGSAVSPLLANIALHGLETAIVKSCPRHKESHPPNVIRYADDFVVLHEDRQVIERCMVIAGEWLKQIGLELKPSKTRIAHTLEKVDGIAGFTFLGFSIRQYKVGRTKSGKNGCGKLLGFKTLIKPSVRAKANHVKRMREIIHSNNRSRQEGLIFALNPVIRGWTNYYRTVVSKEIFSKLGYMLHWMLWAWATRRHRNKGTKWKVARYWRKTDKGVKRFQPPDGNPQLHLHAETPIRKHVKVQGTRSPYNGDWLYWSSRSGRSPGVSPAMAKLLKKQQGLCAECNVYFLVEDKLEVLYLNPAAKSGKTPIAILHSHCNETLAARTSAQSRYE
jgi:RNA-directed DNA polymerase